MSYEHEFAGYHALQRLAASATVQNTLSRLKRRSVEDDVAALILLPLAVLPSDDTGPSQMVAFDGSILEQALPGYTDQDIVGYLSIAAVVVNWKQLQLLNTHRPINPHVLMQIQHTDAFTSVLPGPLVVMDDDEHAIDSFRRSVYTMFADTALPCAQETLLNTYEALAQLRSSQPRRRQRCPFSDGRCGIQGGQYGFKTGRSTCHCQHQRALYSTDALRLHEIFPDWGSCEGVFSETMRACEQLWLIHYLRRYEQLQEWEALRDTIFVLDGPLAVFGSAGWLSRAIRLEIQRLTLAAQMALHDPQFKILLIGVEKTGKFVDYFAMLDSVYSLPEQSLWLLDDSTIKGTIVGSLSQRPYGRNTYYGCKLLYKNHQGRRFVLTMPDFQLSQAAQGGIDNRFSAITAFLDSAWSARYANALQPLVAAHAEAALPKRVTAYILGSCHASVEALHIDIVGVG
jgi:hypothetical protein